MSIIAKDQFDPRPDWILDDIDDYHRTETDNPQVVGLRAALVNPKEKVAQLADAAHVFLSFKNVPFPVAGNLKKTASSGGLPAYVKEASPYDETLLLDMQQRAADKYPEKISPFQAVKIDAKHVLNMLKGKVHGLHEARQSLVKGAIDLKSLAGHFVPKQVMTPEGLGVALGGAGIGGLAAYLSSRPREDLGGQSRAETDLKKMKASLPENPEGIGGAVKKHVVNMHSDVAEQMRKHPVASSLAGAGSGALIATRLAALAGLGSHLK